MPKRVSYDAAVIDQVLLDLRWAREVLKQDAPRPERDPGHPSNRALTYLDRVQRSLGNTTTRPSRSADE